MAATGERRVTFVEEHVLVDDGVRLWTATGGGRRVPLVLCHGGAGMWDYLGPVADVLAGVARVHRWEQRGCGRSERAGPYSIARFVADLEFLRHHHGHERWLVAGHSWGAGLALRYAIAHPGRTMGVLYISGTGVGRAWRDAFHREADRRLTREQRDRREELKHRDRTPAEEQEWRTLSYLSDFADPHRAFALAAEFAAAPYPINFESNRALNAEEKASSEADMLAACRGLRVPVRVVHGERDPRPAWAVEPMVAALPRAELIVIPGVGHLPWLEDPEAFGETIRSWPALLNG